MISKTHKRKLTVATIVLIVAVVASIGTVSAANWTNESVPTGENLNDVVNTSDGKYAVGTNGVVLNRTDGGWQVVINDGPASNGNELLSASVTNDNDTLWFVGASGAVGEYDVTTGSLTDRSGPNDATDNFNGVAVRNESGNASIYIADGSGQIHYSFDNGEDGTWNTVTPGSGDALSAIDFHGPRSGHAVDRNQNVFVTGDGSTWSKIGISNTDESFLGVDSNADDDVWVTSNSGTVFRYNGSSWRSNGISGDSLNDIEVNGATGYSVGGGGTVFRLDNGNWTSEPTGTGSNLQGVTEEDPRIAVGASGTALLRTTPFYEVNITDTNSEVIEGEDLLVNGTVENTGSANGTSQTVELSDFDGTVQDSGTFSLNVSEQETFNFTWSTSDGDNGTGDVTVASANDTDNETVTVGTKAFYEVNITGTNEPVVEGDNLTVNGTVENTGDEDGTSQTVELSDFDGNSVDDATFSLNSGQQDTFNFTWNTSVGDNATDDVTVSSDNDADQETVWVQKQGGFAVNISGTNSPVVEGKILKVDVSVTNTGSSSDTQTITLNDTFNDDKVRDSVDVTLSAGSSNDSITLAWDTVEGDNGTGDVTVASENDTDTETVEVETPPFFEVNITDTNSPVNETETLQVTANVTNTGGAQDTQTITLNDTFNDDQVRDSADVTLDGGNSNDSVVLEWSTASGDNGTGDVTVASDNDTDNETVEVQKGASFVVNVTDTNSPVEGGEVLRVYVNVTNEGNKKGTDTIELVVDNETKDSETVTLGPSESTNITLEWQTEEDDSGSVSVSVEASDLETFSVVIRGMLSRRDAGRGELDQTRARSRELGRGELGERDDLRRDSGRNSESNRRDRGR